MKNIQDHCVSSLLAAHDKYLSISPSHRSILQLAPPSERISGCSTVCICQGYMVQLTAFPAHTCFLWKLRSVRDAGRHEWHGEQEDCVLGGLLQNNSSDSQWREINISRTCFLLSLCTCKKKIRQTPFKCLFLS